MDASVFTLLALQEIEEFGMLGVILVQKESVEK